jgi:hypothetical protein
MKGHAADKAGMTLDELAAFVDQARRQGASGSETPKVFTRIRGTIRAVELKITRGGDAAWPTPDQATETPNA